LVVVDGDAGVPDVDHRRTSWNAGIAQAAESVIAGQAIDVSST
jgi:hypothetical protein